MKPQKPFPTRLVDGGLWPADWHDCQCPYAPPGTACRLGGSPCQLEPGLKADMLSGALHDCRHAIQSAVTP